MTGQIERTLARLRRQANEAKAKALEGALPAEAPPSPVRHEPPKREQIAVAVRSDLLEHARPIALDPHTLQAHRIIGGQISDAGAAAYKMLRTRVLQRMRSNNWQKLAVTSPRANAGKTLTAINLAISLAQEPNQQVVLVDLDLRNPQMSMYLGIKPQLSLADHVARNVPIEKVLLKPGIPRLYIVPSAERLENSSELLASPAMGVLTETLAATSPSTIVIFDLPPLLEADDMLTFMPQVDAVLFVVAEGQTRRGDVEKSNELFKELNVLGTVLNKSDDEAPSYY
jgi:capsular exopolysaccharide synthesis family protein